MCLVCSPEQLTALALGEIRGRSASRLQCHLRVCPDCRAEWEYLSQTISLARGLQNTETPHPMKARLWSELNLTPKYATPSVIQRQALKGSKRMSFKLLIGIGTPAVALALLMLPGKGRHTMSMASEIRQAMSQVNTWHLKGWKMQGKNKIPWEVWGRRAPFFYREQVGQDVIVDDGKLRVSVFAPLHRNNQEAASGIVLRVPSFPDARNARWSYQRILSPWNHTRQPSSQTAEDATFNDYHRAGFGDGSPDENADVLTTVSIQTWLPTGFEARTGKIGSLQTISLLNADYDAPIPVQTLTLPAAPQKYITYDATQAPPSMEYAATANGVTVQATPLVLAPDGKILLRIKTWVGNALIHRKEPLHCDVMPQHHYEPRTPAVQDDQERAYTEVSWDSIGYGTTDTSSLLLLAPADPFAIGASAPSEVTLDLDVTGYLDTRLMGTLLNPEDGYVMQHKITLKLSLPAPFLPIEQTLPAYIDVGWQQRNTAFAGNENLTAATDLARASFHGANQDLHSASLPHLRQAVDYYEKYFVHSSLPTQLNVYRYSTAQLCARMEDKPHARRLLETIIEDKTPDVQNRLRVNPLWQQMPASTREQLQVMERRRRERECKNTQEALDTWAR